VSGLEAFAPSSVFGEEEELWRQRVGALIAVPALLRELGGEPAQVLAAAGLDASALEFAENTVPYATLGRLLQEGARRTDCDHFGLLVGQAWHLSTMGLVGELVRHSSSVGEGLRMGVVYQHLHSQGGVAFLRGSGAMTEFGYAIYYEGARGASQIYDAALSAFMNFMRDLCGSSWVPSEVLLARAPPENSSPWRRLFRCPVRFNSDRSVLRFAGNWLSRPVAGADARVLRELQKQASGLTQPDLIEKLRRSLRVLLLSGISSGDTIADMLAMHRRTLNRRLKAQQTSFRRVLEDVRFDAARQLLHTTHLTVADVAAAIGYAGVSPFTRAFRRRSGTTPAGWRHAARTDGSPRLKADAAPATARF
jgi:AraC-like DNA-binding protein